MRVVIVGTGTEIGKTHVGVGLVAALASQDFQVVGLKPVESGIGDARSDAERLAGVSTFHVKRPAPYRFHEPISPHLAARAARLAIDLEQVLAWVRENEATWTIVELAGGLLSPLSDRATNLDLLRLLAPQATILVAVDRLGVLHDVRACQVALRTLAPELPGVVVALNEPGTRDASTGTNAAELQALGIAPRVIGFPHAEAASPTFRRAANDLISALSTAAHVH